MIVSSLHHSYLTESKRLEADYFLNDDATNTRVLQESGFQKESLSELATVFNPPVFKRAFCENTPRSVKYFQSSDVPSASIESNIFITFEQAKKIRALVKKDWILLTGFGSIGNARLVTSDFDNTAFANNVCRVIAHKQPGYLFAFLASKYGRSQLNQNASGSVVRYIESPGIKKTVVPLLPIDMMSAIDKQVYRSGELRVEATKLLREAEERLLELLGIAPEYYQQLISYTERDTSQSFSVDSRAVTDLTLRARNYSRRLQGIVEELSKHNPSTLESVLQRAPYYTGRFKRIPSRAADALELMSQGDIFSQIPQGLRISPKWVSLTNQAMVKRGSILIPGVGTLGENEIFSRARFVWGYLENKVVAQHLLRIEPNQQKIDAGYLYTVLSSKLWFRILRSSVCGTSLLSYIIPMLNEMPIPRFTPAEEEAIGAKVKAAYERLTMANELEISAIHTVETQISQWQPS
jgi:hypothetical protein